MVPDVEAIRHGRLPRSKGWAAALKIVASVAVCAVVGIGGTAAYFVVATFQDVQEGAVDLGTPADALPPIAALGSVEGGFDLLVVGTDNDAAQGDEYGERDATLNDVNIWLHVSEDHQNAVAVSFPRDLVIPHPECTDPETGDTYAAMSAQPLNEAYSRGGLACVAQTIGALAGVEMDYGASVSFNGVVALSDAIGGVPVCVDEAIFDPFSGLDIQAGVSEVQGQQALAFLRSRKSIGDGGDLSRIASQQSFMSSLLRKTKSDETLGDPGKLFAIARVAADHMRLSTTLADPMRMASLALTLKDVPLDRIVFVQYPVRTAPTDPNKVAPLEAQADELMQLILSDQTVGLDADALRAGVVAAPGTETAPPAAEPPAADPAAPDATASEPGATTAPPASPAPSVVEGVKGQTAAQTTCTEAN